MYNLTVPQKKKKNREDGIWSQGMFDVKPLHRKYI